MLRVTPICDRCGCKLWTRTYPRPNKLHTKLIMAALVLCDRCATPEEKHRYQGGKHVLVISREKANEQMERRPWPQELYEECYRHVRQQMWGDACTNEQLEKDKGEIDA